MSEMYECPKCRLRHVSWDQRCKSWLCLTVGCGYSTKSHPGLGKGNMSTYIESLQFPNGLNLELEDDITARYVADRQDAEVTRDIDYLVNKWKYLCPSLANKKGFDDGVLVPPELLHLSFLARKFGVVDGVIFFQLINSSQIVLDKDGFVRNNPAKEIKQ